GAAREPGLRGRRTVSPTRTTPSVTRPPRSGISSIESRTYRRSSISTRADPRWSCALRAEVVMSVAREPLTAFADGVWVATEPARFLGLHLTATMAVLRLDGDGGPLLYSPGAMTPERRAAVEALGRVAHLYAPNLYHHAWIAEWAAAFPSARLHAPAALADKRRDLRIDRAHDVAPEPALAGALDEVHIGGFRL